MERAAAALTEEGEPWLRAYVQSLSFLSGTPPLAPADKLAECRTSFPPWQDGDLSFRQVVKRSYLSLARQLDELGRAAEAEDWRQLAK